MKKVLVFVIGVLGLGLLSWRLWKAPALGSSQWSEYLGGPERNHFSPLQQLDSSNVHQLQVAWEYKTGDSGQIQCNPIMVDGVLYGMTAATQPFALEAATGKEIWRRRAEGPVLYNTSRGVTYWAKGEDKRILFTNGSWLYALDARTGQAITSFGDSGRISLKAGLGPKAKDKFVVSNTPGTIFENLIIMPLRVHEGPEAAMGHIQAFDVETGKLAWMFHTIPQPGEYGYSTWPKEAYKNTTVGAANNWAGMAVDRQRGIVFVPTGSAAFDYYGGNRKGMNLFANCLLALDARTGKRKWHFQLVHHDILDRDPPAPPNLVTVTHKGKRVEAVAQVTKQGYVFLFDRENGKPLFTVEERKVPASGIPGEEAWPTQPVPVKPAPYARQTLSEANLSPYAENKKELLETFRKHHAKGPFTPLSRQGTIVFPGLDGGAEWGGAAADPDGILYVNSSEMAWLLALGSTAPEVSKTRKNTTRVSPGHAVYMANCTACHGKERKGSPASGMPSLVQIAARRSREQVSNVITHGKGMMPAFTKLTAKEKQALVSYLMGQKQKEPGLAKKEPGIGNRKKEAPALPYRVSAFSKFVDNRGLPAIAPPWGTLNAIDLNTGEYRWTVPFGEYPELAEKGVPTTGAESYGGPVVTASGLLFIAGTKDKKFRVYSKHTGKLLWETELPAAGFATPSTYEVAGKQYVVIACGGEKLGASKGDSYVAFALP